MAHVKYWDENGNLISESEEVEQPEPEPTVEERLAEMQEAIDFLLMQ